MFLHMFLTLFILHGFTSISLKEICVLLVADPGFPRWGRQPQREDLAFLAKTASSSASMLSPLDFNDFMAIVFIKGLFCCFSSVLK